MLLSSLCLTLLFASAFTFYAEKKRVVFFGDSITQAAIKPGGYITMLQEALIGAGKGDEFELIGAGISGNKVPDLQKRLEKDVLSKKPNLVFIYIGVNDVWHFAKHNGNGTPKDQYEAGLNDLISRIKKTGAKVVLCTPAAIGEKKDNTNSQDTLLNVYSDLSRKVAKDTKVPLCDLRKAFITYLGSNNHENSDKNILTSDGVHLNIAGNAFVALQMMAFFQE